MVIRELETLDGARRAEGLVVIVDVFRACSTACAIAAGRPAKHVVVGDDRDAAELKARTPSAILIGKAEPGAAVRYDLPNSPSRVLDVDLAGRVVVHRTMGGARGILAATRASEVICATFPNVSSAARYIRKVQPREVSLVALGHRGASRSAEDVACAKHIRALLEGRVPEPLDLKALRESSGRDFFFGPQTEYPAGDFTFCLTVDCFDFVLRALPWEQHAVIEPVFEQV